MAITLDDLMKLREDKQKFARIDQLIEQRNRAAKALEAASAELVNTQRELASLGIAVEGSVAAASAARPAGRRGRKPGPKPGPKPGAKPGRKPGRPVGSKNKAGAGGRMSADAYQSALDDIGVEMSKAGMDEVKGPDIVSAMARKGFKSKQVVMIQLRKNPHWKMTGVKRAARYHYKRKG